MTSLKTLMAGALAALTLAGCAATPETSGPSVVSYDHGALDTLLELGVGDRVLAVPQQGLPDYLSDLAGRLPDAGSLKEPDMDTLARLDPELVIMTGRQGEAIDDVRAMTRVKELATPKGDYREAITERVQDLAGLYGVQDRAGEALASLWQYVDRQKNRLADAGTITVVTHNDGHFSLRDEAVVYDLLALTPAPVPDTVEPIHRGTRTFYPVGLDTLAGMAPDVLLVVDRSAAIGAEPLDAGWLRDALPDGTRMVVLDPGLWYLSGGGLMSVRLQVGEVVNAVQ